MTQATLNRVLEEIKMLAPAELRLVEAAVQSRLEEPMSGISEAVSAWDVLVEMIGTVTVPADWSQEHDHYLSGTPKRR